MKYKIKLEGIIDLDEIKEVPPVEVPTGELLNANIGFEDGS